MRPLLLLALAALLLLPACLNQAAKFRSATGISPGQGLILAGDLLDTYQGLRRANEAAQTSAKTALDVQPATPPLQAQPEPAEPSLWQQLKGAAALFGF
jgi:hypothetical protein